MRMRERVYVRRVGSAYACAYANNVCGFCLRHTAPLERITQTAAVQDVCANTHVVSV